MMPSGWYQDPNDRSKERYFDGRAWTKHVREDIPDIPLAPWVQPGATPAVGGYAVDTSAPTKSVARWLALGAGALGLGAVIFFGITHTSSVLDTAVPGNQPFLAEDPPSNPGGQDVLFPTTCTELVESIDLFAGDPALPALATISADATVVTDNQPVTVLPPEGTVAYTVLECSTGATFVDGSQRDLLLGLYVIYTGQILLGYEEL